MKPRTIRENSTPAAGLQIDPTLLEQLFDAVPDVAFFIKDAGGRYRTVNESLVRRHGLTSKSQVIGKRPCDICPGEFGRLPTQQDAALLRSGRPLIEHLELHWAVPDEPVWCLTTKLPIADASGKICGLIGFSRDVRTQVEPQEIPSGFAAALAEFQAGLSEEVSARWLADRAGLSPQRLTRLTKRLFGLTPGQLIARIRITAAAQLLRETNRSITEIAIACGYSNHSAFTRAFRSASGVTPSRFREQFSAPG
ncbi:MAG TPA: helix-turn-helix domain-containing protein [Pirellulaceae bacterium]|nr:helix-turn-helix domain-containing protein [Pirellulaceae bacterium]